MVRRRRWKDELGWGEFGERDLSRQSRRVKNKWEKGREGEWRRKSKNSENSVFVSRNQCTYNCKHSVILSAKERIKITKLQINKYPNKFALFPKS